MGERQVLVERRRVTRPRGNGTRSRREDVTDRGVVARAPGDFLPPHDHMSTRCPPTAKMRVKIFRHCTRCIGLKRPYSSSSRPRDYAAAVQALNSLQSNASIVEAIQKLGPGSNKSAIPEMINWVRRIGYEVCVHIRLLAAWAYAKGN